HHQSRVDFKSTTEPVTVRASTVWAVEAEDARRDLCETEIALGASKLFGKEQLTQRASVFSQHIYYDHRLAPLERQREAVGKARSDGRTNDKPIDHQID